MKGHCISGLPSFLYRIMPVFAGKMLPEISESLFKKNTAREQRKINDQQYPADKQEGAAGLVHILQNVLLLL